VTGTIADTGMLAALLGMFENQVSLFPKGVFEEEEGSLCLSSRAGSTTSASHRN
jgi:hypothetical protein